MTFGAFTPDDHGSFDPTAPSRAPLSQSMLCAIALTVTTAAGLWALYGGSATPPSIGGEAAAPTPPPASWQHAALAQSARRDPALFDPRFTAGYNPLAFQANAPPLRSAFAQPRDLAPDVTGSLPPATDSPLVPPLPSVSDRAEDVPLPLPRPSDLAPRAPFVGGDVAEADPRIAPSPPPAERPSFFDRLFRPAPQSGPVLAYAAPDDGGLGQSDALGRSFPYDRWTAVYVIAAHTVFLPDGTQLEAHSGLGARLDDPGGVAERMRGATPPNVYDLQPREALFHGVRALRLNPVDQNATYGRGGLLAHTFMLGPRGDSNGCVVFRNYKAFLEAYDSGAIRRLAVVARRD